MTFNAAELDAATPRQEAPSIMYWMGRPISDLSREELIAVIEHMAKREREHFRWASAERDMWRALKVSSCRRDGR
jgi:hypothetical protein